MTCDHDAQVHAYHDGRLGPIERAALEAHLADCPACAQLLDDLRGVSRLIAAAPLPDVAVSRDRYYVAWHIARQQGVLRISTWLTGAAAAVLVGSLALWPKS